MESAIVLVVDDEPHIRFLVRETLGAAGMTVRSADDGRQALRDLDEVNPDLILLDVGLPDIAPRGPRAEALLDGPPAKN